MKLINKKKKIFIFIEHDIIVRNFIESKAFLRLEKDFNVHYIVPNILDNKFSINLENYKIKNIFKINISKKRLFIWKKLFYFYEFNFFKFFNKDFIKVLPLYFTNVGWKAIFIFSLLNLPIINSIYKTYLNRKLKFTESDELKNLFITEKPDLIIHPTTLSGYFVNDGISICNKLNIPHIFIMNSWDNPSTKKSIASKPNKLLVWGKQTYNHAITYIKMNSMDVIKFGVPQFEIYKKKPKITKLQFRIQHNFSKNQKIILYAGVNRGKKEHEHLMILSNAIEQKIIPNYKILYKPHPWGCMKETAKLIVENKIKHVFPEKESKKYLTSIANGTNEKKFYMASYKRTNDILKSVDLVISPLSTILLEAGLLGLPVLCIFPEEEQNSFFHKRLNKFPHFESLIKVNNIFFVYKKNELIIELKKIIKVSKNQYFSRELKNDLKFIVSNFEEMYSYRLSKLVSKLVK